MSVDLNRRWRREGGREEGGREKGERRGRGGGRREGERRGRGGGRREGGEERERGREERESAKDCEEGKQNFSFRVDFNPRRACAARVTVVGSALIFEQARVRLLCVS